MLTTRNEQSPVLVHRDCRRNFTDSKRSLETKASVDGDKGGPTCTKRLRSSIEPCNLKTQCFLCGKDALPDKKNLTRNPSRQVNFIGFHRNIIEQSRKRNDSWGDEVYTRLNC